MGRSVSVDVSMYVNEEVDVEISDFLDSCNDKDILEIIEYLEENNHIDREIYTEPSTVHHQMFNDALSRISSNYYLLTKEEQELIESIANKY